MKTFGVQIWSAYQFSPSISCIKAINLIIFEVKKDVPKSMFIFCILVKRIKYFSVIMHRGFL
jgi:hypothetical protein